MGRLAAGLISRVLPILGLTLMVTPLALWVAWSQTVLLAFLGTGFVAAVLYCVLIRYEVTRDKEPRRSYLPTVGLSDKTLRDLRKDP